ncbi:MAG: hypothetical protein LBV27_08970 [Oscillospiraceae bacterium]|jgi:hypothetical protein|nr:hypothetical protein [Oscillospiraceae bacterium]
MKRIIMAFVIILSLCFPTVGGYASGAPKVADINQAYWSDASALTLIHVKSNGEESALYPDDIHVRPGDEIRIMLSPGAFVDEQGTPLDQLGVQTISLSGISEGGISVKARAESGKQAFGTVAFKNSRDKSQSAYLAVSFVKEMVSTKELSFDYIISLSGSNQKSSAVEFKLTGTVANPVFSVMATDEYINISDGSVAEATSYVKNIEVDIGNGVSVMTNLFEGTRYYGVTDVGPGAGDLTESYPEIQMVYTLRTIGLKKDSRDSVAFDLDELYYVYNVSGDYLGTTAKPLPFSATYYLLDRKIDRIDIPGENI